MAKIYRRSWSTPEKKIVDDEFSSYFENKTLPSLECIHEVIIKNPGLQNRSPLQVKAYLSNNIQKTKRNKTAKRTRGEFSPIAAFKKILIPSNLHYHIH